MKKRIKHVIFDLGGVLFHWNPQEILRLLKQEDPHFPENIPEITLTQAWIDFDAGILKLTETIEILSKTFQKKHIEKFVELSLEKLTPIEKGVHLLQSVQSKGLPTFVLSNISEEFLKRLQPAHPFLNSFSGSVFSYEIQTVKPHAKIYRTLLDKYHLDPEECLFIDDSPLNVQAAKDMGIDAILCQNHEEVEDELRKRGLLPTSSN